MAGNPITTITKARLIELDSALKPLPEGQGQTVAVQFNPDSLKLSFANQIQNKNPTAATAGGDGKSSVPDQGSGTSGLQYVGAGTTKLSVQLWFDANAGADGLRVNDVRQLTQKVIYFMKARPVPKDDTKFVPPGLRFQWGSFTFDGLVDSIEETIDFFSPEGQPLRASIALGMSQQTILLGNTDGAARPPGTPRGPGVLPLTAAAAGSTLQGLAAAAGGDWQAIAAANGIDNPRLLVPGQLINLSAKLPRSLF